uniref:Ig-like domain-containing protein n=1 Tax=Oreochromis niloticus TaxID=8128 RepID=A0A669ED10_ORENI
IRVTNVICIIYCCSFTVSFSTRVTGLIGHNVTLTCRYDAKTYGVLSFCWGKDRGTIPNRGCANEVLKTDGTSVISRLSERYLLMGNLGRGDVSLTIRQVEEQDSGVYGCRVEIPGWFNDQKRHVTLKVNAGETKTNVHKISSMFS